MNYTRADRALRRERQARKARVLSLEARQHRLYQRGPVR